MYVGTYKCTFFDLNFWLFINPRHTNAQKTYLISFNEFSSCSQPDLVSNDLIVNSSVLPGRLCGVVKKSTLNTKDTNKKFIFTLILNFSEPFVIVVLRSLLLLLHFLFGFVLYSLHRAKKCKMNCAQSLITSTMRLCATSMLM